MVRIRALAQGASGQQKVAPPGAARTPLYLPLQALLVIRVQLPAEPVRVRADLAAAEFRLRRLWRLRFIVPRLVLLLGMGVELINTGSV